VTKAAFRESTNSDRLEETAARCCNEIATYIEKLQAWAAEVKLHVDRAADLHCS